MRFPFITRAKHERLIKEQWEASREILIIRGRLWAENVWMLEQRIKELEEQ